MRISREKKLILAWPKQFISSKCLLDYIFKISHLYFRSYKNYWCITGYCLTNLSSERRNFKENWKLLQSRNMLNKTALIKSLNLNKYINANMTLRAVLSFVSYKWCQHPNLLWSPNKFQLMTLASWVQYSRSHPKND